MNSSRNHVAFTLHPHIEPSEAYADLLARLEARDAEIDRLNNENTILNQRMAAVEKTIGNYPSTEQDGIGRNPHSSVVNPTSQKEGDIAANIEHPQVPNERGRCYFAELISVDSISTLN